MTKPFYDQLSVPADGRFYPLYPDFHGFNDFGSAGSSAAPAGQPHPGFFPAMCQADGSYPYGWDQGLAEAEMQFPPSPGFVAGEGHGLQPQASWGCGGQTSLSMVGGGMMTMAGPMFNYSAPMEDSMPDMGGGRGGGCYEPPKWPQPPMGQISPSPSQSSYYASSPASCGGPQFSRHNSFSSLSASRAATFEPTRFDARFQPGPDQALSPDESQLTPGGIVAKHRLSASRRSSSSASQKTETRRQTRNKTSTNHNRGALSPGVSPFPGSSSTVVVVVPPDSPDQGTAARPSPDEQTAKGSRPNRPAGRQQQQQQQQHEEEYVGAPGEEYQSPRAQEEEEEEEEEGGPPSPPSTAPTAPAAVLAAPAPGQRTRNRAAATKCRAKAKLAVADLESAERAMSSEHRRLSMTARGLRDEVLLLKNELLAHGGCDDALIQQYLTRQARMVGNGGALQQLQHQHQHQHQQG